MTPTYILIHGTDVSYRKNGDQYNSVNSWHKQEGYNLSSLNSYVGYTSLCTGGKEYICRSDTEEQSHCNTEYDGVNKYPPYTGKALSMNVQALGLAIGFDGDIEFPPALEYALAQKRIWAWQDKWGIPDENVRFHREFSFLGKTCPGSLITPLWLKTLLERPKLPVAVPDKPKENMCIAQEKEIADLRQRLAWYDKVLMFFFRRS